jgi:hypothetical protein
MLSGYALILLLLSAAFFLTVPVSADGHAGSDASSDVQVDAGEFLTNIIVNGAAAFADPVPVYVRSAEQWQEAGRECAEKCREYSVKMVDRQLEISENAGHPFGEGWSRDEIISDSRKLAFLSNPAPGYGIEDDEMHGYYEYKREYCRCAREKYNMALNVVKSSDYRLQASIWSDAADSYLLSADDEGYIECEKAAAASAAMEVKNNLFSSLLPLPAWIAVFGIIGGMFLLVCRKK